MVPLAEHEVTEEQREAFLVWCRKKAGIALAKNVKVRVRVKVVVSWHVQR